MRHIERTKKEIVEHEEERRNSRIESIISLVTNIVFVFFFFVFLTKTMYITDASPQSVNDIDPAPLLRLFQDVVSLIVSKKYDSALSLCNYALSISLPSNINFIHERLYHKLVDIINELRTADRILNLTLINHTEIYHLIHNLYIDKLEVSDYSVNYVRTLTSYFFDSHLKSLMTKDTEDYMNLLRSLLETELSRLMQVYIGVMQGFGIDLYLRVPDQVIGGEDYSVNISTMTNLPVDRLNVTLIFVYEETKMQFFEFYVQPNAQFNFTLKAPRAEELQNLGVKPSTNVKTKIIALARANLENGTINGYAITDISFVYLLPQIEIFVESDVYTGQNLIIDIVPKLKEPLSLLIYLDKVTKDNLVSNLTIHKVRVQLELNTSGLSLGPHKLIFLTEPAGKYLSHHSIHSFNILLKETKFIFNLEPIALFPFIKPTVNIDVTLPIDYNIHLYLDRKIIINYVCTHEESKKIFEIETPLVLFSKRYLLEIEIVPKDPTFAPAYVKGHIYVINLPTVFFSLLTICVVLTNFSKEHSSTLLLKHLIFNTYKNIQRVFKTRLGDFSESRENEVIHRKARLVNLYKKIIDILSRWIDPPRSSETLREFVGRVKATIGGATSEFTERFMKIYEEDLYSNHETNVQEAESVFKRLKELEDK